MPKDLEDPTVSTQVTDPAAGDGAQDRGTDTTSAESTSAQPTQEGSGEGKIGPDNLPPELEETRKSLMRDYHAKMAEIKENKLRSEKEVESLKNEASTLRQLMQQEWFKKATEAERARRSGQVEEFQMTDEDFQAATTDKAAFKKLILSMAEKVASAKVAQVETRLGQTAQTTLELQKDREFEAVAVKYKDFRQVNEAGGLDPYLEKGFDFETAYARYKLDHPSKAAQTNEPLDQQTKREGAVSPGGVTRVNGQRIIKAKNLDDAFDKAWEAVQRGEKFKMERESAK